ncbi:MAG: DHH family phosphoesterase [Vibrio sp.]
MHYDVFNGDADGIIALLQLYFAEPERLERPTQLVSGVKRDVKLLSQVGERGDATSVTVLDISMQRNRLALDALLQQNVAVFYCDHHQSGDIPDSPHLTSLINLDAETCTSLLINQHLKGQFQTWAISGAFGDNMTKRALALSKQSQLSESQIAFLNELGTLINYNGYGASLDDLHIPPIELFNQLLAYPDPFVLQQEPDSIFYQLQTGFAEDSSHLKTMQSYQDESWGLIYLLPSQAWARRISGVFGNQLANDFPDKAIAVVTLDESEQTYTISVRAPLNHREGADEVCSQFPNGGGRRAAAGINRLPVELLDLFIQRFKSQFCQS